MTIETYEKARGIKAIINLYDEEIDKLKRIVRQDTSSWIMEIRESKSCSLNEINHFGMLPEFLQAILSKCIAERNKLQKEFDQL